MTEREAIEEVWKLAMELDPNLAIGHPHFLRALVKHLWKLMHDKKS